MVRLPVPGAAVYLLTHPDHIEQVLVTNNRNHWKGRMFGRTSFLFGNGLVLNDGPDWHRQRRLMQPEFHPDRIKALAQTMGEVIDERGDLWAKVAAHGGTVEMESEMMRLTLAVVTRTMFSVHLDEDRLTELTGAFGAVLAHLGPRMATFMLPAGLPIPGERKARRALALIDRFVDEVMSARGGGRDAPSDLLSVLMPLNRAEARDEFVTVLFGGYEATAHALAWAWYLLDHSPDVEARFRQELADNDEQAELPFTRQLVDETLRLYPPFWEVLRSSYEPQDVGEYSLPANAPILLCPFTTHRLPEFWADPLEFRPERFAPDGEASTRPRHAYFPFGAGQRTCIGRHLALLEMQAALSRLGRRFRPRLVGSGPVSYRAQSTLRSRGGITMRIEAL